MLLGALIQSAVLLSLVSAVAYKGTRAAYGLALLTCVLAVFFGSVSFPLSLHALLVGVVALLCLIAAPGFRFFLKASFVATGVCYSILFTFAVHDVREWVRLRERYPFESLEGRLAYEKQGRTLAVRGRRNEGRLPQGDQEILRRLDETEKQLNRGRMGGYYRTWKRTLSLEHLHANYVTLFVNSPGFGFMRMAGRPDKYFLAPRDHGPIFLTDTDTTGPDKDGSANTSPGTYADSDVSGRDHDKFLELHTESVVDFANVSGFGYFRDLSHVAGFDPHRFQGPDPPLAPDHWKLQRLELLSLLRHDPPAVYVSEHLPRMQDMSEARTRPLDTFEQVALDALWAGKDLEVSRKGNQIRMVGSIRAAKQCLRCHAVERGDLLGAFSYRLRRD